MDLVNLIPESLNYRSATGNIFTGVFIFQETPFCDFSIGKQEVQLLKLNSLFHVLVKLLSGKTSDLYSEGAVLDSRRHHRLFSLKFPVVFLSPSKRMPR
jgi:hypothetical protein